MRVTSSLISAATRNTAYRRVVSTDKKYQRVLMSLRPGEDIGMETHRHVEQDSHEDHHGVLAAEPFAWNGSQDEGGCEERC